MTTVTFGEVMGQVVQNEEKVRAGVTKEGAVLAKRARREERNGQEDQRNDQCPRTVAPFITRTHGEPRTLKEGSAYPILLFVR